MNALIMAQLPKAIRWSRLTSIFFLVMAIVLVLYAIIIVMFANGVFSIVSLFGVAVMGGFFWLFRAYQLACQQLLKQPTSAHLEHAVRRQTLIIKVFGMIALFVIVLIVVGIALALAITGGIYFP